MERPRLSPEVVIRAAAEMTDDQRTSEVSMSDLARRFGVRTASLYSHVRDQRAVLDGVHRLALDELATAVGDALAGRSGGDAVRALADAMRDFATMHPGRWAVLQTPAADDVRASDAASRLAGLTMAVFRGYALAEEDAVHATRILGAAVNGFIALDTVGAYAGRTPDPTITWDRMLAALDATFRSWSDREETP